MISNLKNNLWSDKKYYDRISRVDDLSHPGYLIAIEHCASSKKILDVGCGDGSKLAKLGTKSAIRTGCEMGKAAIEKGKEKFSNINFVLLDSEELPFGNNEFDCVTSFFVLEHTQNPQLVISEMYRVLDKNGILILLAPNFGSPNRTSPNFIGNRIHKLLTGMIRDFLSSKVDEWNKVSPQSLSMDNFEMDLDTTVEPYLGSLVNTINGLNMKIVFKSSFWEMELGNSNLVQKIFRFLAKLKIYPFINWGPHMFIIAKK